MDHAEMTAKEQAQSDQASILAPTDTFVRRHVGPSGTDQRGMLEALGCDSLDELIEQTVPAAIRMKKPLPLGEPRGEFEVLADLRGIASRNKVFRSFIGMGYSDTITPPVIQRNILENPGWYTQYTPYQAEIAQGRLEALINFQTMVSDLTGLPLANASLLDEATAAAEAMAMSHAIASDDGSRNEFWVSADCHPQTIGVVQTRAAALSINVIVGAHDQIDWSAHQFCGILLQYPTSDGRIIDYSNVIAQAHQHGALAVVAADLLALTLIKPPGEMDADIAVGSAQRFGVPMGFGGPHAAYMSTKVEDARKMPGRIVGVSRDSQGKPAFRLAIQTREQHIRREKATSNICTAQVLLAVMAGMYGVYHGPRGLRRIAQRVHGATALLARGIAALGHEIGTEPYFDTIRVRLNRASPLNSGGILAAARKAGYNLRAFDDGSIGIAVDETVTADDIDAILGFFRGATSRTGATGNYEISPEELEFPAGVARTSEYLAHPVFNRYHSETEILRYMRSLEARDLSLTHSMIPLGSCTMKLNGTSEMFPVTWPEFGRLHPFAPPDQTKGYWKLFKDLEKWLAQITGFTAVSLQPNAGSQGEFAGLLVIRAYHESRGEAHRNVCLIPTSAHGTNPASAVFAGMTVVPVKCDANGSIEITDLKAKADEHKNDLAALMITYPSTHGVFEQGVKEICKIVHSHGGQVYMDGANMNAQVGLCRPGDIGADVCHLNLHKTFCIPHGGGGPGMGPIGVAKHLAPFLPGHPVIRPESAGDKAIGPISAAPYGSPSILVIPWVYIALMGGPGLKRASEVAILNANYMAARLAAHYPILFKGENGRVAHEFVLDCRQFDSSAGIKVEDIAKRLMDYGFHAPTMSWPVAGTLMIEPTESESKAELDRFCEAMIGIRQEIREIEEGKADRADNVLKNAPHSAGSALSDTWNHKYGREKAVFPAQWVRENKFWPFVGRIDNPFGDRNLVCTCPPMSEYPIQQ